MGNEGVIKMVENQRNRNTKSVQDSRPSLIDLFSGKRPLKKFEFWGDKYCRMEEFKQKCTHAAVWNIWNSDYTANQMFYMFSKYPQISKDMGMVIANNIMAKKIKELQLQQMLLPKMDMPEEAKETHIYK